MTATKKRLGRTLIVGGGIVGLSIAWELARQGEQVSVIDSGQIGRGASWAGAGILPPAANRGAIDPYERLKSLSHGLHAEWAQRLKAETGIDTGYCRCGGIYLARSNAEAATLSANRLWWEAHGIEYEKWDTAKLLECEPNLAPFVSHGSTSAWHLPDECQLRNPRHLQALQAACTKTGVELLANCPVERPIVENGQVIGVEAGGVTLEAERVCICSGAWAQTMLAELGLRTGIMPVRGQMVLYHCGQPPLSRVVNEGNRYLVPRADGRLLAGSVEEEVGFVLETTHEAIAQISGWAVSVLPQLQTCQVEQSWAGLRPGSYDGMPYMGAVPGVENLFVAAGHYRSGLHLSCGTAVVMRGLMLGQAPAFDMRPFRVGR